MPLAEKGRYMTGPTINVTAMNDILVESRADDVTYPFRESTGFIERMQGKEKGSISRKVLRVVTVHFLSLVKDVHQSSCFNLVSYSPVMS